MPAPRRPSRREQALAAFETDYPHGAEVRRLLRDSGSDPVWAEPVPKAARAPNKSWMLLIRLTRPAEERLGVTRELLIYCIAAHDLQSRAITQLNWLIANAPRLVSRDLALVVVNDELAADKLRDWASDPRNERLVVPVIPSRIPALLESAGAHSLEQLLEEWMFTRNLYDARSPVTGEQFFGRDDQLRALELRTAEGSHAGVFGLRKIGKTSLLYALRDRIRAGHERVFGVYIDAQASSAAGSAAHVAFRIVRELEAEAERRDPPLKPIVRSMFGFDRRYGAHAERDLVVSLIDGLHELLTDERLNARVVIVLDEIEVLLRDLDSPMPWSVELLRGIRGISQQTGRLSLVVAGVNSTSCEASTIAGEDNPLFGLLSLMWLGPLEDAASRDMIRRTGRKMGLNWETPAADRLVQEYGGHPLLVRLAASDVAEKLKKRPVNVTVRRVEPVIDGYERRHAAVLREMLESLERYYPHELEVLRLIAADEAADEWAAAYPEVIEHLKGYGVLAADGRSLRISALTTFLQTAMPQQ